MLSEPRGSWLTTFFFLIASEHMLGHATTYIKSVIDTNLFWLLGGGGFGEVNQRTRWPPEADLKT